MGLKCTAIVLLSILSLGSSIRDITLQDFAAGEDVVDAVIAIMDSMFPSDSTFWTEGDDSVFFKDLALVESDYGQNEDTFTVSHLGGIWQVMESAFDETKDIVFIRRNPDYADIVNEISEVLSITWETVTFDVSLSKPQYSLIAARLVLHRRAAESTTDNVDEVDLCETIPTLDNKDAYAEYWYRCYREETSGSIEEFASRIDKEVCSVPTDVMFVLDSSGSINFAHPDNWDRVKYFTGNFTQGLLSSNGNQNRIGVITYSYYATIHSDLTGDRDTILDLIANLPFDGYTTNTALALCQLLDINWREDALRLVILMTDGKSNRDSPVCGSTLETPLFINSQLCPSPLYYVIGVTDNVNTTELRAIATAQEYIDNLDSFENTAVLSEFRRHRTYQICYKASSFLCDSGSSKTNFSRGDSLRYQIDVGEGVTVRLCVKSGQIALYASTTVPTPNRALNTFSFEDGLLNAECEDIFVDPIMVESLRDATTNSFNKGRKRRQVQAAVESITLFVTIEGLAGNSTFTLETPAGNSSIYSTSCMSGLCGANTVCFDEIIGYSCACRDGYTFEDNLKDCKQVNECERQPPHCDLSADCADTVGSFECTCHPGYKGDGRTCVLNDNSELRLTLSVVCGIGGGVILLVVVVAAIVTISMGLRQPKKADVNSSPFSKDIINI